MRDLLLLSLLSVAACGPDYGAPWGAPYDAEEIAVRTPDGLVLHGTLTLPGNGEGPVPAVVTISGSGRQDRDERMVSDDYRPFRQIADTLGRRGIATLRLDDRGVNESGAGPPGATSADFADDIRAAVAYLRGRDEIDGRRLGLVGHSEGGVIAPMVAATDSSLAAVVLLAGPAYTLRRINEFQARRMIEGVETFTPREREAEYRRAERARRERAERDPWFRAALEYDPLPTARRVRASVLLLHGETDHQISPEQADTLAHAFREGGNDDVTVIRFPDTNHLFLADPDGRPREYDRLPSYDVRPEVLGAIADWLVARLGAEAPPA